MQAKIEPTKIDKLVGDRIPWIYWKDGFFAKFRRLRDPADRDLYARLKVKEEAEEVRTASTREETVNEIADLQDAIECVMSENKISPLEVIHAQERRTKRRGDYRKFYLLAWVLKKPGR